MRHTLLAALFAAACITHSAGALDDPLELSPTTIGAVSTLTADSLSLTGTIAQAAGTLASEATILQSGLFDEYAGNPCPADFNQDDIIDFFDYLDFVDAFAAGNPAADFNFDSVIDFFDYLDFVDAYSAGC